ncbi:MAG: FAD:protein FMN transferase, partial [Planctomycetota bacterium]
GQRYSHVLDPKTGRPVENPPASVSVAHARCMSADAIATAMMVLGAERGMEIAERLDVDVLFQDVNTEGQLVTKSRGIFRTQETKAE